MKKLFTLLIASLALFCARANVVINEKNFPDWVLREALVDCGIDDGDGILTDEEIENATDYIHLEGCKNLKGLEYLKNLKFIGLYGSEESYSSITSFDASKFKQLERLDIHRYAITSLDATYSTMLGLVDLVDCNDLTSIKVDTERDDLGVFLNNLPKLTSMENCVFNHVSYVEFYKTGIQDIDMSNHPTLTSLKAKGDDEGDYELNSINVSGCEKLWDIALDHVRLKSVRLHALPLFYDIALHFCHTTDLAVENMANLGTIKCDGCTIQNLTIKGCPVLTGVGCADNSIHNLIIDDSPTLYSLHIDNNMLMWLDMSNVKREVDDYTYWYSAENQHPSATAYKLSPTEVGLRVHPRMDPARMLNLVTNGKKVTAKETTIDDTRYIVFSNEGVNAESLKGKNSTYVYDTKWPYQWIEGSENTKDNNLPVNLYISSVTKHQAFLKVSTNRVEGVYGKPAPQAPTITRSQDYDGVITFSSSNENVVKVDPNTGELTVIGAGTATISVKGAETDYRLAPSTSYTVYIEKATPIISFPTQEISCIYGQEVPLNKLTVEWYEGTVTYSSANTRKATVTAEGVVTTLGAGDVTINGIAPETNNFKRAQVSYVLHIGKASPTFAFEKEKVNALVGQPVPENKLTVGLYDGKVQYTSSNETIASITSDGQITLWKDGTVTITASGPETENCYQAVSASYTLEIEDPDGIVSPLGETEEGVTIYDLSGRKVNSQFSILNSQLPKGIYIKNGKKVAVK